MESSVLQDRVYLWEDFVTIEAFEVCLLIKERFHRGAFKEGRGILSF